MSEICWKIFEYPSLYRCVSICVRVWFCVCYILCYRVGLYIVLVLSHVIINGIFAAYISIYTHITWMNLDSGGWSWQDGRGEGGSCEMRDATSCTTRHEAVFCDRQRCQRFQRGQRWQKWQRQSERRPSKPNMSCIAISLATRCHKVQSATLVLQSPLDAFADRLCWDVQTCWLHHCCHMLPHVVSVKLYRLYASPDRAALMSLQLLPSQPAQQVPTIQWFLDAVWICSYPARKDRVQKSALNWAISIGRLKWIHGSRFEMDGEMLSCDLKCSTHLGQSSSMTRKDRDLLRFDAGYFWIADTSKKVLELAHTWHYLTSRLELCQSVLHCVQEFMKKAKAITVIISGSAREAVEGIWREGETMADNFSAIFQRSLCQGPNWRQEDQGLKRSQESKRSVNQLPMH